ncbi:hypothetical protein [Paenibacillus thiaminolyticus]|uniref:Uncharacterized protein n=1 Tax=Paenibacillus thiaminolyticus TaxID=49283 RepID=A0A3A3GN61_PANTH|nr:hypothetical protein [Paenibacillus thiaminolyticus]RJG26654.1 hypothetical protein DQX05_01055 [Paenibacillus thiaminolyticus]
MAGILGGGLLILSIGMVDDRYKTRRKDFPALPKLIVQVGAAPWSTLRESLSSASTGYLRYNKPPANVFMGDAVGVPIFDNILVIIRRM